jgi:hypothetical protein
LVTAGCDDGELRRLLALLWRASETEVWTKEDLIDASKLYERAANKLLSLKNWGEARNLGLAEDSERWLAERYDELSLLTKKLGEWAPKADKRNNPRLGRARARLIHYVRQKTKSPRYVPVSVLISAAIDKYCDPDSTRHWWKNNETRFASTVNHE